MAGVVEALVRAETFYTIDDAADLVNAETLVIGGKTYTFQDTLTDSDGNVHIGATVADTVTNLLAAINLSNQGESAVGAGTDYAASMTRNSRVFAVLTSATVLTVRSHVPGTIGNLIPMTIGTSAVTVDNALCEGGTGNVGQFFDEFFESVQLNSEAIMHLAPFGFEEGGALD